jgi:DNA-binding LacI/PurR family transcriptional regulator
VDLAKVARVTSADVAREAAVSRATVSYVLNDKAGQTISPETREAVLRAARRLGYRPNPAARRLAGGGGGHVIFLAPTIRTSDQLTAISVAATRLLAQRGKAMSVAFDLHSTDSLVGLARATGADTVISLRPFTSEERARLESLGVQVADDLGDLPDVNDRVGHLQVAHLHECGNHRLAFARPVEAGLSVFLDARQRGVMDAATARALPAPAIADFGPDGSNAAGIVSAWHDSGITAVAAYNDDIAMRVLHGIRLAGLRCPDDLAVIGVDDTPAAAVTSPPLSSVSLDADGFAAILIERLFGSGDSAGEVSLTVSEVASVVTRASTSRM